MSFRRSCSCGSVRRGCSVFALPNDIESATALGNTSISVVAIAAAEAFELFQLRAVVRPLFVANFTAGVEHDMMIARRILYDLAAVVEGRSE